MKSFVTIVAAIAFGCGVAAAQYMPANEGTTFSYTETSVEPKAEVTLTWKVVSAQTQPDGVLTVRIEEKEPIKGEMFETEVTSYSSFSYNPADKVTTYTMMSGEDFKASIVDMLVQSASAAGHTPTPEDLAELNKSMKVRGDLVLPLPENPEVDTPFDKSVLRCTVGTQSMTITISKGLYKGFEEIETPAGKFNCLKVEYTTKRAMGGPVENDVCTSWFAPGVGVVKTVTADKKGKVKGEVILNTIAR